MGACRNKFFFSQLFLFTKVASRAFGTDIGPKPNPGHKSIRCVEMRRKTRIPGGVRDFSVEGMNTRNGETWDVSGIQLYVVLPL